MQKLIDELTIRAPAAGIVGARYYENGEYVKENEKLATLMDTSSVFAVLSVQEQDAVGFMQGTRVSLFLPSLGKSYESVIAEISPAADPQSGNFSIKTEIDNKNGAIKPAQSNRVCLYDVKSNVRLQKICRVYLRAHCSCPMKKTEKFFRL